MTRRGVFLYFAGLALAAALPVAASRLIPETGARCEQDLSALGDRPAAEVLDEAGGDHLFCSIECAEAWLARSRRAPASVLVRDESTGRMVEASEAVFVRSRAGAMGASGLTIHAFLGRDDAARHAEAFRGTLLAGAQRPFRVPDAQ